MHIHGQLKTKMTIYGVEFEPHYPLCQGCPHLCIGQGCVAPTDDCEYPDSINLDEIQKSQEEL